MDEKTKAGLLGDIEYFSAKLEADNTSMLFLPLAKAYVELNLFDDAVGVLIRGLDANPDVSTAKTLLAQCYVGMGRVDEAKALLTEIRVLDPNNYAAEKLLGKIYQSENEYKKAIVSYKNAYFSAPEDPELRELIEELLAETGMELADLRDERKLMDDDELLDSIGQELADEVKHEIGETAERPNLSEDDVKSAVEDIVGHSADIEDKDLGEFAEDDSPADTSNEIESEMLAEVSDDVEHTESLDEVKDAVQRQEQQYFAGVQEPDAEVEGGVDALAAELSADFGLGEIKSEQDAFADEKEEHEDAAEDTQPEEADEHHGQEEQPAAAVAGEAAAPEQSIFDDFGDIEEISDEHLASIDDLFSFTPVSEDGEEMEAPVPTPVPVPVAAAEPIAETAPEEAEEESSEPQEIDAEEQLADITSDVEQQEQQGEETVAEEEPEAQEPASEEPETTEDSEPQPEEAVAENIDTGETEPATAETETAEPETAESEMTESGTIESDISEQQETQVEEPVVAESAEDIATDDEPAEDAAVYDEAVEPEVAEEPEEQSEEPQMQADEPEEIYDELITDERIDDALKDVLSDAEHEQAESADEIIPHNSNLRPVIDIQEADKSAEGDITDEPEDAVIPEDIMEQEPELVSEIKQEIEKDSELNDELATLFAMDELEERDRKPPSDEYVNTDAYDEGGETFSYDPEQLDNETYEQVNRLENLLELIKNNSK